MLAWHGVVLYICNPATWKAQGEGVKFKPSVGNNSKIPSQ
jgi:hypothetical protein